MNTTDVQPSVEQVNQWLSEVPDPEIPVVSVIELGMVRDVCYEHDTLVVTITPTYSACPATSIIKQLIRGKLKHKGVSDVRVEERLSPAWTTDWMTDAAREKLRNFGIAPPVDGTAVGGQVLGKAGRLVNLRPAIACPRCGSENTEKVSEFGSTPCKAAYRCRDCLEPFDYFKCM